MFDNNEWNGVLIEDYSSLCCFSYCVLNMHRRLIYLTSQRAPSWPKLILIMCRMWLSTTDTPVGADSWLAAPWHASIVWTLECNVKRWKINFMAARQRIYRQGLIEAFLRTLQAIWSIRAENLEFYCRYKLVEKGSREQLRDCNSFFSTYSLSIQLSTKIPTWFGSSNSSYLASQPFHLSYRQLTARVMRSSTRMCSAALAKITKISAQPPAPCVKPASWK